MPLVDVPLARSAAAIPPDVRRFLRDADERIERFLLETRAPAFVPSDFDGAYRVLTVLADGPLLRGRQFCEWGSGFGVVACLAAGLEYDACGIEVVGDLVDEARKLADDFDLSAEFVRGSFVPRAGEARVVAAGEYAWFTTDGDDAYDELGLDPSDMDVIFAYPWPDEEAVTADLFDRYAGVGAVLVTYHGNDAFRARRKTTRNRR